VVGRLRFLGRASVQSPLVCFGKDHEPAARDLESLKGVSVCQLFPMVKDAENMQDLEGRI
jgi:hypothetical protein